MRSLCFYFTALFGMTISSVFAGELVQNLKHKSLPLASVRVEYAARSMEAVLPRLKNPDLKGGSKNWQNAWEAKRFTVTYLQAVNYAHALQGGGEWKEWLPKTLIPRKGTSVKMGYDDRNLYMQIRCSQPQLAELLKRTSVVKRDTTVWANENLDVLITENCNSNEYYQFMVDCKGSVYDAHQFRNKKAGGSSWNTEFYRHISYGKDHWTLTLALPVTKFGMSLKEGSFIDCNIGRVEIFNREHSTLSPVEKAFNQPDRFCRLWIGRKTHLPSITAMEMKNPLPGRNELLVTVNNPTQNKFEGTVKSGSDVQKVSLAPKQKKVYKFVKNAAVGTLSCQAELFNTAKVCLDMASTEAQVLPIMTAELNTLEYMAGGSPIHTVVKINAPVGNSEVEISCGKQKKKLKANSELEFDLQPDSSAEQADLKISLIENGKTIASVNKKITISKDPFDE